MKASDAAAPDADSKHPALKPSGALSNPDPTIKDMTTEEYNAIEGKSAFFRPAAKKPKMDGGGFQCSLIEADDQGSRFHQDTQVDKDTKDKPVKLLPILSVSACMFICKCRCVCVVDCACMINNVVHVPLPG